MSSFLHVENLTREYQVGDGKILAIDNMNFEIEKGEFTVILGPSGSGKSTLLNILGGMDRATSGKVMINENNVSEYSDKQLDNYRRGDIGFVFQFYNLMPNLTAKENIDVARVISENPMSAKDALTCVGLSKRAKHFPAELSGGEQQRISIARAICKNPKILLCDEPTGALDSETGKKILTTLLNMCKQNGHTVIIVTHNSAISATADRVIHLRDGKVVTIECNPDPISIEEVDW